MPLLHTLDIQYCEKLKELSDGLRFITNLECLIINSMGDEFKFEIVGRILSFSPYNHISVGMQNFVEMEKVFKCLKRKCFV